MRGPLRASSTRWRGCIPGAAPEIPSPHGHWRLIVDPSQMSPCHLHGMDRAHARGGTRENDGLETGMMGGLRPRQQRGYGHGSQLAPVPRRTACRASAANEEDHARGTGTSARRRCAASSWSGCCSWSRRWRLWRWPAFPGPGRICTTCHTGLTAAGDGTGSS